MIPLRIYYLDREISLKKLMKEGELHKENIRFSIAAKVVVLAAFLILLWEDHETELYAFKAKKESVMNVTFNSFSKDLGGSTEHWYSEGWPYDGRPLKK